MKQLLIDNGVSQRLLTVEDKAKFSTPSHVIWDTRKDGPIPSNLVSSIGGLERVGNTLVVNAAKFAAHQAAVAAKAQQEQQRAARIAQAKQALNDALLGNGDPDLTAQQLRQLLRFIRVILKDVSKALD
jgi:hypothetical protein